MSVNTPISYILYNNDIIVNLYKLHFPSSHFSLQSNKKVFHSSTFPLLQPNTHERKPNIFYPLTNFPFSHFFTPPTKRTINLKFVMSHLTYIRQLLNRILCTQHLVEHIRSEKLGESPKVNSIFLLLFC